MSEKINPLYLQPGTRIGFYEVVTQVGRGGFGALYKVLRDGEAFALKLSTFNTTDMDEEERQAHEERADREVVALKSLRHPNIVRVHAFERWPDLRKGYPYIVMDFIEGYRLYDWRAKHNPSPRRIAEVFQRLALALNEMHRLEVFHRDLKSENVLVRTDGEPIVIDFGISRPKSAFTLTRADAMIGTYTHFSPEYCKHFGSEEFKRGERFVYRATADLHAVGYMLYQCITGRPPFSTGHENAIELMQEIESVPPPPPRSINPHVPAAFENVVTRLLEKDPALRYQSGAELAQALSDALAAADASWDSPLPVPPRPGRTAVATVSESKVACIDSVAEASSSDVVMISDTAVRPPDEAYVPRLDDERPVEGYAIPSSELIGVAEPGQLVSRLFAPPTTRGRGLIAPEAGPASTPEAKERSVLSVPSVIRREGEKIEAARREAERSRRRKPLLVAGGLVTLFAAVFALAFADRSVSSAKEVTTPSFLSEVARTETTAAQITGPAEEAAGTPGPDRSPGHETQKPAKGTDAKAIDELLAKTYGRPKASAQLGVEGPSWLLRAKRNGTAEGLPTEPKSYGVPMGAKIRVRLMTNLDSRTIGDGPVEAMLTRPFVQRGEVIFPSRTMVYGRATTSSGRFVVSLTRLRLPDDSEIPFAGLAMNPEDSKPGLPAGRRIASSSPHSESLSGKVAKNAASTLLGQAASADPTQVANAAGQTVLNHQEQAGLSAQEALLLDRGADFDVFVREAF